MTVKRGANVPVSEATRERPWQILLTGKDLGQIDEATRARPWSASSSCLPTLSYLLSFLTLGP